MRLLLAIALAACLDDPPSTEDGHDPDADVCCWGLVFPWLPSPPECLCGYTAEGTKKWLECVDATYWCDKRGVP